MSKSEQGLNAGYTKRYRKLGQNVDRTWTQSERFWKINHAAHIFSWAGMIWIVMKSLVNRLVAGRLDSSIYPATMLRFVKVRGKSVSDIKPTSELTFLNRGIGCLSYS